MARYRAEPSNSEVRKMRPALNPNSREKQMISLAVDLAEKQLREGTASATVITHYLKLGTEREILEREKLQKENAVLEAKASAYKSAENVEELYRNAIDAMKSYSGRSNDVADEEE